MQHRIIELTAQIVSAHVSAHDVSAEKLPGLIREVHQALSTADQTPVEAIKAEPAVDVKESVFPDHIVCLDCGRSFKMLKWHLDTEHQMTPAEYRLKWGLPASYPMVAADYSATRSKISKDSGFGRRAEAPPPPKKRGRPKKG